MLGDAEGKAVLSQVIADYLAAHPQVGGVAPQVDSAASTAATMGDQMQAGDRSGDQQGGVGGETVTRTEPQPGTAKEEDAPACI